MPLSDNPRRPDAPVWAIVVSLLVHGLVLFIPQQSPPSTERSATRIEARLARLEPKPSTPSAATPSVATPPKRKPQKNVLAVEKSKARLTAPATPQWSVAEKAEMNDFLRELDNQPRPSLAQRSLAMARELGREQARQDEQGSATLERRPNSPPVDPFSLEMYLDALVDKLNRSAAFVRSDPRTKGVKAARVKVLLNPDGALRSFQVLNAADQQDEIAFIKAVVEQAVPFAAFPPDLQKSARSLGILICIRPAGAMGGAFGFTRNSNGQGC